MSASRRSASVAPVGGFDAAPDQLEGKTEEDAVVAFLQVLGTMVNLDESKVYRE